MSRNCGQKCERQIARGVVLKHQSFPLFLSFALKYLCLFASNIYNIADRTKLSKVSPCIVKREMKITRSSQIIVLLFSGS